MVPETTDWLISWDDQALEVLVNITQLDCDETMIRLRDGSAPDLVGRMLRRLLFRSRLNSQRSPEIWVFGADAAITEQQIRSAFESDPEPIKRLIRARGISQTL